MQAQVACMIVYGVDSIYVRGVFFGGQAGGFHLACCLGSVFWLGVRGVLRLRFQFMCFRAFLSVASGIGI